MLSQTGLRNDGISAVIAAGKSSLNGAQSAEPVTFSEFALSDDLAAGETHFQPGDLVKVSVWGYPELDHTATIQPNGRVTLPLAGEIDAAGTTSAELRQRIVDRLEPYTREASGDLRPGDSLSIEVWQHSELRYTAVVEPSGYVTFPLAGRFLATGRPVETIRKEAEEQMLRYLRDARVTLLPTFNNRRVLYDRQVSVLPQTLQPRRVAVIGEVGVAGVTEIRGSMRVVDALAQAQLRDKTAELNSIVVIRNPDGRTPQYRMIRLTDFFEGRAPDQNVYLRNNDIIVVPKNTITKVDDFVEQVFSRTAPAFSWWTALFQATVARDSADTTRLINDSLRRSINDVTINPSR